MVSLTPSAELVEMLEDFPDYDEGSIDEFDACWVRSLLEELLDYAVANEWDHRNQLDYGG